MRIRDFQRTGDAFSPTGSEPKSLMTLDVVENPIVSITEMSASACINTDAIDYQGEAILAGGVRVGNYLNNPIVLYEHGKGPIAVPIGISESPSGDLMIERSDFDIHATCYFSQTLPVARQLFGLVDEGVLRATSIHVMPSKKSMYIGSDGRKYPVTEESDLIEWSWCMFGVNPEAVKKSFGFVSDNFVRAWNLQTDLASVVLSRGSLGGDLLLEPIRKSLLSILPSPVASSPGADFVKESTMATDTLKHMTKLELKKLSKDDLASLLIGKSAEYDAPTLTQAKSLYEEVTKSPMETATDEVAQDKLEGESETKSGDEAETATEAGNTPLGATVTSEVYAAMKFLIDHATKAMGPVENEVVKAGLSAAVDEATTLMDTIAGIYASAYPDLPSLGAETPEGEEAAVEEQLKSMLAGHRTAGFRTLGMVGVLDRVAADPAIGESQRKSLRDLSGRLGQLVEGARTYKPAAAADTVPLAKYEALEAMVGKLADKIAKLVVPAS